MPNYNINGFVFKSPGENMLRSKGTTKKSVFKCQQKRNGKICDAQIGARLESTDDLENIRLQDVFFGGHNCQCVANAATYADNRRRREPLRACTILSYGEHQGRPSLTVDAQRPEAPLGRALTRRQRQAANSPVVVVLENESDEEEADDHLIDRPPHVRPPPPAAAVASPPHQPRLEPAGVDPASQPFVPLSNSETRILEMLDRINAELLAERRNRERLMEEIKRNQRLLEEFGHVDQPNREQQAQADEIHNQRQELADANATIVELQNQLAAASNRNPPLIEYDIDPDPDPALLNQFHNWSLHSTNDDENPQFSQSVQLSEESQQQPLTNQPAFYPPPLLRLISPGENANHWPGPVPAWQPF